MHIDKKRNSKHKSCSEKTVSGVGQTKSPKYEMTVKIAKSYLIWTDFPRTDILPFLTLFKKMLDHRGPTEWLERTVDTEVQKVARF